MTHWIHTNFAGGSNTQIGTIRNKSKGSKEKVRQLTR